MEVKEEARKAGKERWEGVRRRGEREKGEERGRE